MNRPELRPTPAAALARRPMARARRIAAIEREVRERLSPTALEALLEAAEVISEGQVAVGDDGAPRYYGSTMVTLDLPRLAGVLREPCDALLARRLAALLGRDGAAQARVRALGATEAARRAGGPLVGAETEVRVRVEGPRVFLDVDVEGRPPASR